MRFPAKKNAGCPKATCDFPPRKDGILCPPSGCLGTPLPLPQILYGREYGRTLTSQPKFLGSIGYQICLATVLRWRAMPAAPLQVNSISWWRPVISSQNVATNIRTEHIFWLQTVEKAYRKLLVNLINLIKTDELEIISKGRSTTWRGRKKDFCIHQVIWHAKYFDRP